MELKLALKVDDLDNVATIFANGISDGTAPTATMTREQLVTMLYRIALKKAKVVFFENAENRQTLLDAGIVMAEPVSGLLSPMLEEEFSSPYVKKIVDAVKFGDALAVLQAVV